MANTVTGRILSISPTLYITTKKGDNLPKRMVVIDCTRFDPWTGEKQGFENTPELEFASDLCAQLDQFKVGDVVSVAFDVTGIRYTNRDNVEKIFTSVRPYRIEKYGQQSAQTHSSPVVPGINSGAPQTIDPAAVYGQPKLDETPSDAQAQGDDVLPF